MHRDKQLLDRANLRHDEGDAYDYEGMKPVLTPSFAVNDKMLEGGALREGGAPILWSRDYIGLLAQYAAVGMLFGTLPGTVYPFLLNYLYMEGTQIVSARVLLNLPWSFKVFYGILTDCFPICGYRRRPFMVIGWTLTFITLLTMACMNAGDPYFPDRQYFGVDPSTLTPEIVASFNTDARQSGGKFIFLMMVAAIGYVGADVAADAVVVELAQREPEVIRGTTQTTIYIVRTVFVVVANVLTGFAFNGVEYGGTFDFSLTFPQLMLILALFCLPIIPITWAFIKEDKCQGVNLRSYINDLWELLQLRVVYQVLAYKFFSGIFENFTITCSEPIQSIWAKATPFNSKVMAIAGNSVLALVLFCTGKYGLHWNWRWMHFITVVVAVILDAVVTFLTTWDVVRNQWFWLGVPVVENIPNGMGMIIGAYVFVELAGEGNEGAVYGLCTSVFNLAIPFASTITKNIDGNFDVTNADIVSDTHDVRWQVSYVLIIRYAVNLLGLAFLPLLPPQKTETQELKRSGGSSKLFGMITVAYLAFAFVWSTMVNILSMFESTMCLKIVGGPGC